MRILINYCIGLDADGKELHFVKAAGDSSETKPTENSIGGRIIDGSSVLMTDSSEVYLFNEKTSSWIKSTAVPTIAFTL